MGNLALIEELERQFGDNPQRVFARLASEYRKAGDLARAIELCRTYVPQQPGYISGHIVLGQALYESGELDEAQQTFETALQLDPENLIALRQLGDIAHARGDLAGARSWYTRLLDVDPQNEEVVAQLAALDNPAAASPSAARAGVPAAQAADTAADPSASAASFDWDAHETHGDQGSPAAGGGRGAGASGAPTDARAADVAGGSTTPSDADLSAWWDMGNALAAPEPDAAAPTRDERDRAQPGLGIESFVAMFEPSTSSDAVAEHEPVDAPVEGFTSAEENPFLDLSSAPHVVETGDEENRPFSPIAGFALPPLDASAAKPHAAASKPEAEDRYPWEGPSPPVAGGPAAEQEDAFAARGGAGAPADESPEPWSPVGADEAVDEESRAAPNATRGPDVPDAFLTETMAELYVQQGLLRQAVDMYRRLVTLRPEEQGLRARLFELQDELALAEGSAPRRDEAQHDEDLTALLIEPPTAAEEGAPAAAHESPAAPRSSRTDVSTGDATGPIGGEGGSADTVLPADHSAPRRQTVRAFFSALGSRRSGRATPQQGSAAGAVAGADRPHGESGNGRAAAEAAGDAGGADAANAESRGSDSAAEPAASTPPRHDLPGEPSRAAPSALSLDEVFRETIGRPPHSGSGPDSLDEFFSEGGDDDSADGAETGGAPPPSAAADLEAFNAWLEGLKK